MEPVKLSKVIAFTVLPEGRSFAIDNFLGFIPNSDYRDRPPDLS